jgi:hypothetical protein
MLSYIKDNNGFYTVVVGGKCHQFDDTHPKYGELVECVRTNDCDKFVQLVDVKTVVNTWGQGKFLVKDGILTYDGNEVHRVIGDRIMQMIEEKFNFQPMLNFIENLYQNPSFRAINELYNFLEHKFLPITPDGYFLAYKAVTKYFKDKQTQTVDNSVGQKPKMPRGLVNDDCEVGCAEGYHAGSIEYVRGFKGSDDVVVICKINPKDVVSIPKDCNQQKLRCCEYEVIGLFEGEFTKSVETKYDKSDNYNAPASSCFDDDDEEEICLCGEELIDGECLECDWDDEDYDDDPEDEDDLDDWDEISESMPF